MNQLESLDWKRRKENADRIIAEQQAMFDRFNNVQKSLAQQQQEGFANRQNPMLQGGSENVMPLGSGTITRKPCYRCKRLKEQYGQMRSLCTFFQVLSGCLTLALVAALVL